MLHLFLLLMGTQTMRRRWRLVGLAGFAWGALGLFIFLDSLDHETLIPIKGMGALLVFEALVTLGAALGSTGTARRLRVVKGAGLAVIGWLTISEDPGTDVALALLIGTAFAVDGVLKITTAHLVRFHGWRSAQVSGGISLLLAVGTLQPWPTWYVGTIGCNVGLVLLLTGASAMRMAHRLRRLGPYATFRELAGPAWPIGHGLSAAAPALPHGDLIVHVWTAAASAETGKAVPASHPSHNPVDRYIAARNADGTVSTGHAALEMAPDIYISHYPAEEIQQSGADFRRSLIGTAENNRAGRFLPSHDEEVASWCAPTMQIRFTAFDAARLRAFWDSYRQDATYNLTSRNCSSVVAAALDAALEGALVGRRQGLRASWPGLWRAALSPELWAATVLRKRAETMAWTPGLVLDYARAMGAVLDPPDVGWIMVARQAVQRSRRARPVGAGSVHRFRRLRGVLARVRSGLAGARLPGGRPALPAPAGAAAEGQAQPAPGGTVIGP